MSCQMLWNLISRHCFSKITRITVKAAMADSGVAMRISTNNTRIGMAISPTPKPKVEAIRVAKNSTTATTT